MALRRISKMKVHPEMFMKTKEREKIRVPNARKGTGGPEVRSQSRLEGVLMLTSSS